MDIVVYYYTYYSLGGSTRAYLPGSGKGSFPEGGFSPRRRHPINSFISFSHSTRVIFVHGEWAIEKGGVPASFGRYGAQRARFAHSTKCDAISLRTTFEIPNRNRVYTRYEPYLRYVQTNV